MKKRLILWNTAIVAVALLLMFGLGILVTNSDHYDMTEQKIKEITHIYAANYSDAESLTEKVSEDIRVTVVDATGRVTADSDAVDLTTVENHITREEIVAALEGHPKTVTRDSDTLGVKMMYYAEKVETGDTYVFIRVAIPVESVNSYIYKSVVPLLFIMLVALACSVLFSVFLGGGLLKPLETVKRGLSQIERGTYREIPPTTDDEEINRMLVDINTVSGQLQESIETARRETEKLDSILNNISDGIVVIDAALTVTVVNRRAEAIFGVRDAVGREIPILTSDPKFVSAMTDCAKGGKESIFQMEVGGAWYLVAVREAENRLVIAVLTDITAAKNSEQTRLDFFANASHELKTPLTTIKGFNDMVTLHAQDEQTQGYAARIEREVSRMLALLDDMLNLSRLENGPIDKTRFAEVSLGEVAQSVEESLKLLAQEKKVTVSVEGDASLFCDREHAWELIKNLTENAIRYNREGGEVRVTLSQESRGASLVVEDNGIGIDAENQSRLFERFYRVDRSRSRATGGTGLGLAIVKHICELYGAEISLTSKLGVGTRVTVTFPAKQ